MANRHSENAFAKIDTDIAQAWQRVADTLQAAATQLPDTDLKDDLAHLFREDPHQAELDLRDAVGGMPRISGSGSVGRAPRPAV